MTKFLSLLSVIILISWSQKSQAQTAEGQIKGTIEAVGKTAMEGTTIMLLKAKDSAVAKVTATDKEGQYHFEKLSPDQYFVSATSVGYAKSNSEVVTIDAEHLNVIIKTIQLLPQSSALSGVTVVAKRPFIEQKPGKTVLNVEASPTNTGLNALELLEKSPGVSVDNDGNISLKGKQGVLILVDGKPTYMSGADLANLLKNMQSTSLDQIEIMTNPPAKYDAAGNSGIINIKTKKGLVKGMNGSANLGYTQGYYGRVNGGLNLNYRNNKLNLFGGYNGGTYQGYNILLIDRNFYKEDKVTAAGTANQESKTIFKGTYHNVKAGMDYYFSKKDVAGIVINSNFGVNRQTPNSVSNIKDVNADLLYQLQTAVQNKNLYTNITTNANYKHTFDSTGRELSADLDYGYYHNNNNTFLNTQSYDANQSKNGMAVLLQGLIPSNIHIYSGKVDYVHPLKKGAKLEAGAKTSFVQTDNRVAYTRNSNGTDWTVDDRSNHFVYKENINAVYGILSKSIKKWELTGGLRLENTIAKGHQIKNDSLFTRNYTNLFPNVGVGYTVNKKNVVNVSYSRRITRPDYEDLNPFVYFIDSLTYGQGNPYLQPQFTNNFEVSHTYNRFLTTTFNYTKTNDIITQLLKQDNEKKATYQTRENFSSMDQLGMAVMINKPIKKWWNTSIYANVYHNHYQGLYQNDPIDISFTSFTGNMTQTFTLGKGWSTEISGWYRSKGAEGLLIINGMGAVNSGITKQILHNKGNIKFGVRDIFKTQQFSGYAKYSDVDVLLSGKRDTRQFSLNFTYRFGKKDIPAARRKTGGAEDEQSRIHTGN